MDKFRYKIAQKLTENIGGRDLNYDNIYYLLEDKSIDEHIKQLVRLDRL